MTGVCLRDGALAGRRVIRAGAPRLGDACVELGAEVVSLTSDLFDEDALAAEVAALPGADAVLADASTPFTANGGGYEALRTALDGSWNAVRAVANAHLIEHGGRVLLLAPPPGAGEHAVALRAALENTARTLSTEWTRHETTSVAVLPGDLTTDDELAGTVTFLLSEAGAYFSGCAMSLR